MWDGGGMKKEWGGMKGEWRENEKRNEGGQRMGQIGLKPEIEQNYLFIY